MSTRFICDESPIWEYPSGIAIHPAGACDGKCNICLAQEKARMDGTARIVGTMIYSGTEQHSTLHRSFIDWLLGRPGKWIAD